MMPVRRVKLTPAQAGALECRGLDDPLDHADRVIAAALAAGDGAALCFPDDAADEVWAALNDHSNAEDDYAEDDSNPAEMRTFARRAARSLAALGSRVLRG